MTTESAQSDREPPERRQPVPARAASTLVLMRSRATDGGGVPEVLMVQRHGRADFVPGAFVFPGGMVEPADSSPLAERLSPRLTAVQAQATLAAAGTPVSHGALGWFVAAIREAFEECGLLLARDARGVPPSSTETGSARRAVTAGEPFLDLVVRLGWTLATEELIYFAHWTTPEAVPKRFDTRFFLAQAPAQAEALADHTEVVGHRWVTPGEALRQHTLGGMPMIEPTVCNLELLQTFDSQAELRAGLRGRRVRTVLPKLVQHADGRKEIVLPWDRRFSNS